MSSRHKSSASAKGEYIETETGNKISRNAQVIGAKHIVLAGKCVIQAQTVIRGDLIRPLPPPSSRSSTADGLAPSSATAAKKPSQPSSIHLGRYVFVSPNCTLSPPSRVVQNKDTGVGEVTYLPMRIADFVFIGAGSNIRAAEIRSGVWIGSSVTVGNMCMIKENVKVLDGAVLPAGTVWGSGCVVGGSPARVVGEVAEGWGGGLGTTGTGTGTGSEELVGVRCRERWASVGNKRS